MIDIKNLSMGELAAYYYWDDMQSLNQALMVCYDNFVDIEEVERWSISENQHQKFLSIKSKFISKK